MRRESKGNFQGNRRSMTETENDILPARGWFALYTAPRSEKKVEARLGEAGVEHFLPMLKVMRRWSDRVKVVEVPLFSSYIFVRCLMSELGCLNRIYGVVRIVYYNGRPAKVREEEIGRIRDFVKRADRCELVTGDRVEVVCGLLKGEERLVSGQILYVQRDYLVLYLEQIGVKACVKKCEVKKIQKKKYEQEI